MASETDTVELPQALEDVHPRAVAEHVGRSADGD